MTPDPMAPLSRSQREAVESAGYRVVRWLAARRVLQTRVEKGRITGALGDFLTHWLGLTSTQQAGDELKLSFDHTAQHIKLTGGSAMLATSPLEHALLHLPALRPFWSQELRRQHFMALRALIPQAWLLDAAEVPHGAVIQGLDAISWEKTSAIGGQNCEIQGRDGSIRNDWHLALAARESILAPRKPAGTKLNARYVRNDKHQVVLRSVEASP